MTTPQVIAYRVLTAFLDRIKADEFVTPQQIDEARAALVTLFASHATNAPTALIQGAFIGAALTAFGMGLIALVGRYGP